MLLHPCDDRGRHHRGRLHRAATTIGEVIEVGGIPPHLHFAIAERRGGTNFGINIFNWLLESANTQDVARLTFSQDGQPPQIVFPI